jgi:hypothetical protein
MNLNSNKARLVGLAQEVSARWAGTKSHWRDARAHKFEQRFMVELFPRVNQATAALDKLDEIFKRIRKDCE